MKPKNLEGYRERTNNILNKGIDYLNQPKRRRGSVAIPRFALEFLSTDILNLLTEAKEEGYRICLEQTLGKVEAKERESKL